jgi:GT2 family glycosyltransferase
LDLGGFEERLFLYYEDQELSTRFVTHGLTLSITDAVTGRHTRGGSSGADGRPRPVAAAASALSSIELVGINHGPRVGRRAWTLYQGLRRCAAIVVWLTAIGPLSARSARKRDELRSTQSAETTLLEGPGPRYPLVKIVARRSA